MRAPAVPDAESVGEGTVSILIVYANRDRGQYAKRPAENYLQRTIFPETCKMIIEE
jgi:hypothetical protein